MNHEVQMAELRNLAEELGKDNPALQHAMSDLELRHDKVAQRCDVSGINFILVYIGPELVWFLMKMLAQ